MSWRRRRNRAALSIALDEGDLPSLSTKNAIAFPGDLRTSWLRSNVAEATSTQWDGYVLEGRLTDSDVGDSIHSQVMKHTPDTVVNSITLAAQKTDLTGIDWSTGTKPKWLFQRIDSRPSTNHDWNNSTHRSTIAGHFSAVGTVLAALQASEKIRFGLLIDLETYDDNYHGGVDNKAIFEYAKLANPSVRTYAQTRDDVRTTWKAWLDAFWDAHPSGHVILTLGTHYVVVKAAEELSTIENYKYGLICDAVDGMLDSKATHSSAYLSDYVQLGYNNTSVFGHAYYKDNSTWGYDGNAAVDAQFRATNVSDLKYDRAVWTNSAGRFGTTSNVFGTNKLTFESSVSSLFSKDDYVYASDIGMKYIQKVSTTDVTLTGLEFNSSQNQYLSKQAPIDAYNGLKNGKAAAERFCLVYMGNRFKDGTNVSASSRTRYPSEIRNAWLRVNQGLDSTGLTTLSTTKKILIPTLSDIIDTTTLINAYLRDDVQSDATWTGLTKNGTFSRAGEVEDYHVDLGNINNNRLSRATGSNDHAGSGDIWWGARFRLDSTAGNYGILGIQNELIMYSQTTGIRATGYASGVAKLAQVTSSLTASKWHGAQAYKSGTNLKVSVDQSSEGTVALGSSTLDSTTNNLQIGDLYSNFRPNGDISEVIMLKKAPSTTEKSRMSARLQLHTVEYWKTKFDAKWATEKATAQAEADAGNSYLMLDMSYQLDGLIAMYEACGDTTYISDAIDLTNRWIGSSAISSSLTTGHPNPSQFLDSYMGWQGWNGGRTGLEYALDESYYWKYVARMLRVMKENNLHNDSSFSSDYLTILAFCESNLLNKWYNRGNDGAGNGTLFRGPVSGVHMTSQWYQFCTHISYLSTGTALTQANVIINAVNDNVSATPSALNSSNLRLEMNNHTVHGTSAFEWDQDWGGGTIEDWSHANDVVAAIIAEYEHNNGVGEWTKTDIDKFVYLLNFEYNNGLYPQNVDGTGGDTEDFIASGFCKLGRFDITAARNIESFQGNTEALINMYGNCALNARKLCFI